MGANFYWYDYETWGAVPSKDRPCQFAGIRTDTELNEVGEPLMLFSRPATDLLPQPDACLITGISPQRALREGLPESDFAARIQQVLAQSGTCSVGYNSIRFDEEVTRWLFYRNLLDPYAHAWQNGNSRWDIIDVLRLAHALRPDGIQWPEREPGVASFKLEHLTAANGIEHAGAHDALSDVRATIAMARLLKQAQPRLFDYALTLRDKRCVADMLAKGQPLIHASQRIPAALGCIAPMVSICTHPTNPGGQLLFDLRQDPEELLSLSAAEVRARLFVASADLPEGVERIGVKGIKLNASPMLSPLKTLNAAAAVKWGIDPELAAKRAVRIRQSVPALTQKLIEVYQGGESWPEPTDAEDMLYAGGFFSDADRREMTRLRALAPDALAVEHPGFKDPRLETLLFRLRARNWPETLNEAEREEWHAWRFQRLTDPEAGASIVIDAYQQRLDELAEDHAADDATLALLEELSDWAEQVMDAD